MPYSKIERDLNVIQQQENALVFSQFSEDSAWKLGTYMRELAYGRSAPIVIQITRGVDIPLFAASLPGSVPDNWRWIQRKTRTVWQFSRSSYGVGLSLALSHQTLEERYALSLRDYAVHGGCFPLRVQNSGVIGVIGVSGLPQRQDHLFVIESLCHFLKKDFSDYSFPE